MGFDVSKHSLVPKHTKLSEAEKTELLKIYSVELKSLPKISKKDASLEKLNVKAGDVIKIERISKTIGKALYYRAVVE